MNLLLRQEYIATVLQIKVGGRLMKRMSTIFKPPRRALERVGTVEELVEEDEGSKVSATLSEHRWVIFIGPLDVDRGTCQRHVCILRSGPPSTHLSPPQVDTANLTSSSGGVTVISHSFGACWCLPCSFMAFCLQRRQARNLDVLGLFLVTRRDSTSLTYTIRMATSTD